MLGIPEKALEQHIGILGKTGSGKSNTAKVIAESLMFAGGRVCVIDPTGTWWGMRLHAGGAKPSKFKPVIFGGNHADIPITGDHGAAIAEAIATSSTSAIIDTRLLSVSARTRFFTAFGETLLAQNKGPLTLIIDEAHLFAPQGRVNDPQSGAMLHAANNLVSLGRGIGLRIILISQRPAKLHKDSLTQVETLVAMRLIAPQDRAAIEDWIGEWAGKEQGKEITSSLASLPTGEAWVWAPELKHLERTKFPLATTFDSGQPTAAQQALSPLDVSAITSKLETIRQDVVANDPVRLKRRVAELEKQIATAKPAPIDPALVEQAAARAHRQGYDEGYAVGRDVGGRSAALNQMLRATEGMASAAMVVGAGDALNEAAAKIKVLWLDARNEADLAKITKVHVQGDVRLDASKLAPGAFTVAEPAPPLKRPVPPEPKTKASGDLSPAKRKILVALRELEAIGKTTPDKQSVAWFAGASPKSSSFANNLGSMRSTGLIDYPGQGLVTLTDAGRAEEPARAAPAHEDLMTLIEDKLSPALIRMLRAACSIYPEAISTEDLAAKVEASATSSTFANNRGRLRSFGLIDYPSSGLVRAADLLFPEGKN